MKNVWDDIKLISKNLVAKGKIWWQKASGYMRCLIYVRRCAMKFSFWQIFQYTQWYSMIDSLLYQLYCGAWSGVVVKALRY